MISDVVVSGLLGKIDDKDQRFRYITCSTRDVLVEKQKTFKLPLMYWTKESNNLLNKQPINKLALVKGRIEYEDGMGLYILVETLHICN